MFLWSLLHYSSRQQFRRYLRQLIGVDGSFTSFSFKMWCKQLPHFFCVCTAFVCAAFMVVIFCTSVTLLENRQSYFLQTLTASSAIPFCSVNDPLPGFYFTTVPVLTHVFSLSGAVTRWRTRRSRPVGDARGWRALLGNSTRRVI